MSAKNTIIGLGMAALGRPEYINVNSAATENKSEETFKQNAFKVLDEAYRRGILYFDTAPSYGKGEAFLTEWNNSRNNKDVFFGTKWGYTYVANWILGYEGKHEIKEHSLAKLEEQWEISKVLLPKLTYYQIHSATLESGVLSNIEVLEKLAEIKQNYGVKIGLTTSGTQQQTVIEEALKIKINNTELFDSFQVTYNILEQSTHAVLEDVKTANKTIIVKEALANGRVFRNKNYPEYQPLYTTLEQLATKYNVGIDAVALRFCMDNLQPNIVLSGASTIFHLEENLKANTFSLSEEELQSLKTYQIKSAKYWDERSQLAWH
ncbi:aldo/keto reductase [Joostella sp. CR20]|uniref:aldo/keto reductase n=1 Tax=Joostella sp. CR20 TaxID=2804312 RepID=UPI00313DEDB6